jgi:hypothetical protein
MQPSPATISDRLNALYACAEIGYEDHATLLEASKLLIVLTSYDPSAFTDFEIGYIKTQMSDAEFYANRYFHTRNPNNGEI